MCIPGGLLFIWSVLPSFRFRVLIAASQKKTSFDTLKMEKALSMGQNGNQPPWSLSPSQGSRTYPIWPHSNKLCHDQGQT
jgi:hypothetical protein